MTPVGAELRRSSPRSSPAFQVAILLLINFAARIVYWCILPPDTMSVDIFAWKMVCDMLARGINPYEHSGLLNYPPFWMEVLSGIVRAAPVLHTQVIFGIRAVLLLGDMILLAVLTGLLYMVMSPAAAFRWLLWGYALNPLVILLTVQHGNLDAFPMICVVAACICLIRHHRRGEPATWLWAAAWLGIGAFTKTVPILLFPLLAPGAAGVKSNVRWLGLLLLIGPVALSLLPIYTLSPEPVTNAVLAYRSVGKNFGILGIGTLFHARGFIVAYSALFPALWLGGLVALAADFWRRGWRSEIDILLAALGILLSLFTLGTGYGTQYWFWIIPTIIPCLALSCGSLRRCLIGLSAAAMAITVLEYMTEVHLGSPLLKAGLIPHLAWAGDTANAATNDFRLALLRLPISLAAFLTLLAILRHFFRRQRQPAPG